ncbi:MAG: GldM family protein [Bacteroidota bacterium]
MKHYIIFLLLVLPFIGFSQTKKQPLAVVAVSKNNFVYRQISNPLTIAIPGYNSSNNIVVQTNVGQLTNHGDTHYELLLDSCKESMLTVSVFVKTKKGILKKISSHDFKIFDFPEPSLAFGSVKNDGYITYEELNKANSLYLFFKEFNMGNGITYKIQSFSVIHNVKSATRFFNVQGNSFSDEMKESFKNANNEEQILISNVKVIGPTGTKTLSKTLMLRIRKS